MMVLCCFHFSEYLSTALINPGSVSTDSFLLNHSRAYSAAALSSWLEFWLERALLPGQSGAGTMARHTADLRPM